jgi:hypothetical protein
MCDGFFKRVRVKSEFFEEFLWFLDLKRVVRFGDSYIGSYGFIDALWYCEYWGLGLVKLNTVVIKKKKVCIAGSDAHG